MAVVINEFEVVAEAPPAPPKEGGEAAERSKPAAPITPPAIAPAFRALEVRALRAWAH